MAHENRQQYINEPYPGFYREILTAHITGIGPLPSIQDIAPYPQQMLNANWPLLQYLLGLGVYDIAGPKIVWTDLWTGQTLGPTP